MWWYGGPWTGMMGSWWWGLHMLVGALVWIGIVALGLITIRRLVPSRRNNAGENTSSPIAILQERYARGEIGRDEYMEKQRDLRVSTAP
jgi:putative membrane protein